MANLSEWRDGLKSIYDREPHFKVLDPLLCIQSLTAGLKSLGADFSVSLLFLGNRQIEALGDPRFNALSDHYLFSREVFLLLNGTPVVWAQSLCQGMPSSLEKGRVNESRWLEILDCGTEPLGHKLFDGSLPITRTPFEYAVVKNPPTFAWGMEVQDHSDHALDVPTVIARRSIFDWAGDGLELTEYYLPALFEFIGEKSIERAV
ncbi:chorismate lyase [Ignatzschineria sp. RMDPL8A]|uniref:chorismate--pyruvate lyase family protein n=1 Tax=Ignatzschineria sp. RMDPL8A TaxID=2999236 RepID=UPI00244663B9|nr:chorismate lyase [Ignatzschineria sp. RMDPL8A]MDG9730156.1 chorismate lyase [Ignatzschineria sp. RMDPL8A]